MCPIFLFEIILVEWYNFYRIRQNASGIIKEILGLFQCNV